MVPLFSAGYFGAKKSKCTITGCRRASELKQCARSLNTRQLENTNQKTVLGSGQKVLNKGLVEDHLQVNVN